MEIKNKIMWTARGGQKAAIEKHVATDRKIRRENTELMNRRCMSLGQVFLQERVGTFLFFKEGGDREWWRVVGRLLTPVSALVATAKIKKVLTLKSGF